ncbi:MAG TPA: diguanylate cyclase, partial [Baekduia sp.]|nr:diguanylate cyclase [Baekduia sp.]
LRALTARAETSAALTDSVFKALGAVSGDQLTAVYGGGRLEQALELQHRRSAGSDRASRPVFMAVATGAGRTLASRGQAPARFAFERGMTDAQLSDVLPAGGRKAIQFAVPFRAKDGSDRVVVQGLTVALIRSFLGDFLARLPRPRGERLSLVDGAGVLLAGNRGARGAASSGEGEVVSSARVPGTTWRLRLAASEDQVFAAVTSHRSLPWLLLAGLALAAMVGLWLSRRLDLAARTARAVSGQLRSSRHELENLIGSLEEGVAHLDRDGRVHLLNDSARRLLDVDRSVVAADEWPWDLLDEHGTPLPEDHVPGIMASRGEPVSGRIVGVDGPGGKRRWLRVSAHPLARDDGGAPYPVVMSFSDVTAQRELELHLTRLADCDPLTGLLNRRRFESELAAQVARCRRYDEQAALLLLDIDSFKAINDSLGHLAGDEVLRAVADAIRERLRAGDRAGRLGGDEFALLLAHTDEHDARRLGLEFTERIREAIRTRLDGLVVNVTFGVSALDDTSTTAEAAMDASDRNMYERKPLRVLLPEVALGAGARRVDSDQPQALSALLAAIRARDPYTASHSRDVVALARAVAVHLGLTGNELNEVEQVALVHDIGKIAIPDAILRKPGALNADERLIMRQHPVVGAQIVAGVPTLQHLAPAVRAEHERWDGGGYPDGLAGEAIPLASRIVFVCDAFHAMTSERPYGRVLSEDEAAQELRVHAGSQFCPAAAAALLEVLAGSRVGAGAPA